MPENTNPAPNPGQPTPPPVTPQIQPVQPAGFAAQPNAATGYTLAANIGSGNGNSGSPSGPPTSLSALLGPKPVFSQKAFEEAEERRTGIAKGMFWAAVVVLLGTWGYFTSQLNPEFTWFGQNTASRFEDSNEELAAKQTELNYIRFRTVRLLLDDINGQVDTFARQTLTATDPDASAAEKEEAEAEIQVLGAGMKKSLLEVQKILAIPLGVETYSREPVTAAEREQQFEKLLIERINREKSAAVGSDRLNANVLRLVEKRSFRELLKISDVKNVKEASFLRLLTAIRMEGTDELSSIQQIRQKRLNWVQIIQDIHEVTSKVDGSFGRGLFKVTGGFLFSAYQFDAKTKRITISGITKTPDSKTFSFIANLVDVIEKSPKFKDIDFRSFSKNRDEDGDFSSSINLEFTLQGPDEVDPRDDVISSQ